MLGVLAGSRRYAHIAGVRGDAVAAQALGLKGIVSEDSVRRALKAMAPESSEPWMRQALMHSVRDALDRPWVLDLDATIKPLYDRQAAIRHVRQAAEQLPRLDRWIAGSLDRWIAGPRCCATLGERTSGGDDCADLFG